MAFNKKLQKLLEEAHGVKPFNCDNVFKKKKKIQEATYFALVKTQGIINGGKTCRSMGGCSA
jgi:hypothetical protein